MAVPGNAYPAVQLDARGDVVDSGVVVQFTDSTDQPGSGGGAISVTDGSTTVNPATELDFTSGATVTDGGGGVAQVAVGGSGLLSATVVLTSAQILALNSEPVEIIPAPGAGKVIVPFSCFTVSYPGDTPYTDMNGEIFVYDGDTTTLADVCWDLTSADQTGGQGTPFGGYQPLAPTAFANKAVKLMTSNADPTDGNGTAAVTVWYVVADVPA